MRGALCVATRLYILYLAADESISGWEFFLLIPKSPQMCVFARSYLVSFVVCVRVFTDCVCLVPEKKNSHWDYVMWRDVKKTQKQCM